MNDEEANAVRRSAGPGAAMMCDMKVGVTRTNMEAQTSKLKSKKSLPKYSSKKEKRRVPQ
jgi:hypothetical protein